MQKINTVFQAIFAILGIAAIAAVISGAYHQLLFAAVCIIVFAALAIENEHIRKQTNKP
jgi:hypothetical protein